MFGRSHPLLRKEKEAAVRRILPKELADSICPKGSCLAHLYGLPKTHKPRLGMRSIIYVGLKAQSIRKHCPSIKCTIQLYNNLPCIASSLCR